MKCSFLPLNRYAVSIDFSGIPLFLCVFSYMWCFYHKQELKPSSHCPSKVPNQRASNQQKYTQQDKLLKLQKSQHFRVFCHDSRFLILHNNYADTLFPPLLYLCNLCVIVWLACQNSHQAGAKNRWLFSLYFLTFLANKSLKYQQIM